MARSDDAAHPITTHVHACAGAGVDWMGARPDRWGRLRSFSELLGVEEPGRAMPGKPMLVIANEIERELIRLGPSPGQIQYRYQTISFLSFELCTYGA